MGFLVRAAVKSKEADALKKGIGKNDIPEEYKHLKMLGGGNTSIALEKDENTVIVLTRDAMKKEWLHWGLKIAKDFSVHEPKFKRRKMDELSIYAIEMPKLEPLSPENKKKVNKEIAFWKKATSAVGYGGRHGLSGNVDKLQAYYIENGMEESMIYELLDWLLNYGPDQFGFDIAARQFMQDTKGQIYLIDPVASTELTKLMFERPDERRWG